MDSSIRTCRRETYSEIEENKKIGTNKMNAVLTEVCKQTENLQNS